MAHSAWMTIHIAILHFSNGDYLVIDQRYGDGGKQEQMPHISFSMRNIEWVEFWMPSCGGPHIEEFSINKTLSDKKKLSILVQIKSDLGETIPYRGMQWTHGLRHLAAF